jgi:hypothetical protein
LFLFPIATQILCTALIGGSVEFDWNDKGKMQANTFENSSSLVAHIIITIVQRVFKIVIDTQKSWCE